MVSNLETAKRVLVTLLKSLVGIYSVVLGLTRESTNTQVKAAYKKVSLKAHPDQGGEAKHQAALHAARDTWEDALRATDQEVFLLTHSRVVFKGILSDVQRTCRGAKESNACCHEASAFRRTNRFFRIVCFQVQTYSSAHLCVAVTSFRNGSRSFSPCLVRRSCQQALCLGGGEGFGLA